MNGAPQPPNTYVRQLAAGGDFSLVLKSGTDQVWGWGNLYNHRGGDGYPPNTDTPIAIDGLAGVRQVAAGDKFALAVKWNGTVWIWGEGDVVGEDLGYSLSVVQVAGLTDVVAVAAGSDYALALKSDGTVWAWGLDVMGQLGDGAYAVRSYTPVQVGGATPLTGVMAIAAGADHSLALKRDGTVWGWGSNGSGQIGGSPDSCTLGGTHPSPGLFAPPHQGAGHHRGISDQRG